MGKLVIVDGFNVIRRDPELSGIEQRNFLGAQEVLARRLAQYRRYTAHQIIVVFDGGRGEHLGRQHRNLEGIDVVYSAKGETADEVIVEMVQRQAHARTGCLVITADRDLASACRRAGVNVLPPEALLRQTRQRQTKPLDPEYGHGKKEEQAWMGHTQKKGNPRRRPKAKRRPKTLW